MEDIAFHDRGAVEPYAVGVDVSRDLPTHGQVVGENLAFHLGAFGYRDVRSAQFALDSPEHLYDALAGDLADDRHAGADIGDRLRSVRIFSRRRAGRAPK